ncbi:MAG: FAD-binding oxidoreductase, partial [Actinobacteria bacterium]|nr:FAD-binding oxidoreductase [Actinomycetota bacterium]
DVLKDMESGVRDAAVMEKIERRMEKQAGDAKELDRAVLLQSREALDRMHPKRVSLKVAEIIEETESTRTLRFEPADGELPFFRAGQYVNLFVDIDGVLTSRPYSISSAPGKPYWDLTVRRMPAGFVSGYLLDRVKVGDVFESTGPSGSFYYEPLMDTDDLVFLAGGSGITPFASIIREAAEKKSTFEVQLIYGSRDPSDIIFKEELQDLAYSHPGFKADFVISEPAEEWAGPCGLLDAEMISELVGPVEGKTFYVCGPAPMYPLCEGALEKLGVPAMRIRKEVYGPPADVTEEPGWPGVDPKSEIEVVEERSGRSIRARAGEPLMNSLEREGLVVPAVCRAGECTACRTRLLEGKVFAPGRVRLRWVDEKAGYIHPCMSYPLEDIRIRI